MINVRLDVVDIRVVEVVVVVVVVVLVEVEDEVVKGGSTY